MNRKNGTGAAALCLTAALAACGGSESTSRLVFPEDPFCQEVLPAVQAYMSESREQHPTPDDARYGGTVVVADIAELPEGMNVATNTSYTATQHQQYVNLMPLILYDENIEPMPWLAESWEVSDDGTELTFHLRRDVYWHDGEQTDAHDVEYTYLTVTDPATAFPNAAFWDYYVRGEEGIEVLDDFTVRIHLQPHAGFLDPFTSVAILPEHLLGDVPVTQLRQHPYGSQCPVGNGPFIFAEHRPQDRWVFEANPGFPQALGGRPFVDRYVFRVIPEQTTILTELLTENVDVYIAARPEQAELIVENPNVEAEAAPFRQYDMIGWNSRRPQLQDPRVRRAITMGLNRREIVDAIRQGYGSVANSTVPPFHYAYDPSVLNVLSYDPDGARALLEEAGWVDRDGDGVRENADGIPLDITVKYNEGNQDRADIAEIVQSQLAGIGIAAQPVLREWGTLLQEINDPTLRDFDGVIIGWVTEFKLDDTPLFHSSNIDEPYGWSGTNNPEIDRLLETLTATVDRDEALPVWREYQQAFIEEQPYTLLYFVNRINGVNNRVQDEVMDVRGEWLNIKDWWLER